MELDALNYESKHLIMQIQEVRGRDKKRKKLLLGGQNRKGVILLLQRLKQTAELGTYHRCYRRHGL